MDAQGRVTVAEVHKAMLEVYGQDREANLQKALFHALRDDLKPMNDKGRWKANPLLVLVAFLLMAVVGIFLYFSRSAGI
jgi:hypothetical protein